MPAPKRRKEIGGKAQALLHFHPSELLMLEEPNLTFFEKKNSLNCKEELSRSDKNEQHFLLKRTRIRVLIYSSF